MHGTFKYIETSIGEDVKTHAMEMKSQNDVIKFLDGYCHILKPTASSLLKLHDQKNKNGLWPPLKYKKQNSQKSNDFTTFKYHLSTAMCNPGLSNESKKLLNSIYHNMVRTLNIVDDKGDDPRLTIMNDLMNYMNHRLDEGTWEESIRKSISGLRRVDGFVRYLSNHSDIGQTRQKFNSLINNGKDIVYFMQSSINKLGNKTGSQAVQISKPCFFAMFCRDGVKERAIAATAPRPVKHNKKSN